MFCDKCDAKIKDTRAGEITISISSCADKATAKVKLHCPYDFRSKPKNAPLFLKRKTLRPCDYTNKNKLDDLLMRGEMICRYFVAIRCRRSSA